MTCTDGGAMVVSYKGLKDSLLSLVLGLQPGDCLLLENYRPWALGIAQTRETAVFLSEVGLYGLVVSEFPDGDGKTALIPYLKIYELLKVDGDYTLHYDWE